MRDDETVEGAFQANNKGRSAGNLPRNKLVKFSKRKTSTPSRRQIFLPCLIAEELTMLRNIVGLRVNLLSSVCSVIIWVIVRNFAESRRNNCHNPIFDHFILIIIIILFIKKDKKIDDNDEKTSKMK